MKNICTEISWLLDDALRLFRKNALVLLLWPLMSSLVLHIYQNIAMSLDYRNYVIGHPAAAVVVPLLAISIAILFFNAAFIQMNSLVKESWVAYIPAFMGSLIKSIRFLFCVICFAVWHLLLLFVVSLLCGIVFYVMSLAGLPASTNPFVVVSLSMIFVAYLLYVLVRSLMLGHFVMQSEHNAYQTFVAYLQFSAGSYRWTMILMMIMMAQILQVILVGWPVAFAFTFEPTLLGRLGTLCIQVISGGLGWTLILLAISVLGSKWQQEQLLA